MKCTCKQFCVLDLIYLIIKLCSATQLSVNVSLSLNYWICISTENLKQLIASSKECGITFYYALSPGLDILFSNSRDIQLLKKKMDQVQCNNL